MKKIHLAFATLLTIAFMVLSNSSDAGIHHRSHRQKARSSVCHRPLHPGPRAKCRVNRRPNRQKAMRAMRHHRQNRNHGSRVQGRR